MSENSEEVYHSHLAIVNNELVQNSNAKSCVDAGTTETSRYWAKHGPGVTLDLTTQRFRLICQDAIDNNITDLRFMNPNFRNLEVSQFHVSLQSLFQSSSLTSLDFTADSHSPNMPAFHVVALAEAIIANPACTLKVLLISVDSTELVGQALCRLAKNSGLEILETNYDDSLKFPTLPIYSVWMHALESPTLSKLIMDETTFIPHLLSSQCCHDLDAAIAARVPAHAVKIVTEGRKTFIVLGQRICQTENEPEVF